jgi:PAS domain S-box-containing protein
MSTPDTIGYSLDYQHLFEHSHCTMLIVDPADGRIVEANAKACAFYGWPREEMLAMRIADINVLPQRAIDIEMERAFVQKRDYLNLRHRLADGRVRDVEVFVGPVSAGRRQLLYSIVHDVTDKRAEEQTMSLLAQRALYLLELPRLADALDEATFLQRGLEMAEQLTDSPVSFVHFVNDDQESLELIAWSRGTLESYCQAISSRHYPISAAGIWAEAVRQHKPVVYNDYATAPGRRGLPDGHAALTRLISLPVIEQGKVVMLAGIGNKAEAYTQQDIETLQLIANDLWQIVRRMRAQSALESARKELAGNLAHERELNKQLEEAHSQLLQSEKMASIGQLAAGVAHELNNPIGFVNSNLGTLDGYLKDVFAIIDACEEAAKTAAHAEDFARIEALKADKDFEFLKSDIFQLMTESKDGLSRVSKIIRDLRDFSRAGDAVMQWADLHEGLDSTLNIIWNELKYTCEVKKEYGELPEVWCEPSQLNQVFMNLMVNAGHAIRERGTITLRTRREGDEVCVSVSDTGCGISAENLKRIFEPFYTTKPVGKGTGLGLSLAYGIIQKHKGRIEVDSEVGKGTTFRVWLPIQPQEEASAVPPAPTPGKPSP